MTEVVTALTPQDDSRLAASLEAGRSVHVLRRCADVAELLSICETGLGDCAVVSADLRGLDLSAVGRLRSVGLLVVGVYAPDDEGAERRLRQLSITSTLPADATPAVVESLILDAAQGGASQPDCAGAGLNALDSPSAPGCGAPAPHAQDTLGGWVSSGTWSEASGQPRLDADATRPGTLIAVWGPLGAPGRTTVAVNLAAELAGRGLTVLLVDADTYGGCVAQTLGLLDEAPGLAAAARAADQGSLDVPILARLAPEALPGLRVLTGVPRADRWPEITAEALERVLELGRALTAVVVVDCGFCLEDDEDLSYDTRAPRRNAATLTTLAVADTVLAVGAADAVSLQRFVRGLQQLGTVPCPTPVPVVNRVRASSVGPRPRESLGEVLRRFAGIDAVHLLPEDRDAVDSALLAGRTVVEDAPDSPFRRGVQDLATALMPASRSRQAAKEPRAWRRGSSRGAVTA